jgi:hypothetical protein
MKRPRGTGSIFQFKGCGIWYLKYYRNGVAVRESSGTDNQRKAEKILQQRIGEIATGTYIEPINRKITVDELYSALLDDYKNNELASYEGAQQRWQRPAKDGEPVPEPGRLKQYFGGIRALSVTTDMLNKFVGQCREKGISNATTNRGSGGVAQGLQIGISGRKDSEVSKLSSPEGSGTADGVRGGIAIQQAGEARA